jgi:ABC-type dipeptide/oligopeptide/nickel transport system permease component
MAEPIRNLNTPMKSDSPSFDHEPSENVRNEIATLRSEIANLREMLAEKTGAAYDKVAERAGSAASYVHSEASSVAGTIREHPAATTTLFTLIGAVGFAIGYVVATASADSKQAWYDRYLSGRL